MTEVAAAANLSKQARPTQWLAGFIHAEARAFLKRLHMNRQGHKGNIAYTKHRFPDTSLTEVQARIADLSKVLRRFHAVQAEQYDDNIFSISTVAPVACKIIRADSYIWRKANALPYIFPITSLTGTTNWLDKNPSWMNCCVDWSRQFNTFSHHRDARRRYLKAI